MGLLCSFSPVFFSGRVQRKSLVAANKKKINKTTAAAAADGLVTHFKWLRAVNTQGKKSGRKTARVWCRKFSFTSVLPTGAPGNIRLWGCQKSSNLLSWKVTKRQKQAWSRSIGGTEALLFSPSAHPHSGQTLGGFLRWKNEKLQPVTSLIVRSQRERGQVLYWAICFSFLIKLTYIDCLNWAQWHHMSDLNHNKLQIWL